MTTANERARSFGLAACVCATIAMVLASVPRGEGAYESMAPGYPYQVTAMDPSELAMLARWCLYTQGFRTRPPGSEEPAQVARYNEIMGPTFLHMHHYCEGLMKMNRGILLAK